MNGESQTLLHLSNQLRRRDAELKQHYIDFKRLEHKVSEMKRAMEALQDTITREGEGAVPCEATADREPDSRSGPLRLVHWLPAGAAAILFVLSLAIFARYTATAEHAADVAQKSAVDAATFAETATTREMRNVISHKIKKCLIDFERPMPTGRYLTQHDLRKVINCIIG